MRYDSLRTPISEADPCGPDLDEEGDDAYLNYMLVASGRLPTKFFNKRESGEEAPFDKASIDLEDEVDRIGGFLERSRDVRLLTLEARFQILTGSIVGFSEAVQGIAILVGTFWDKFLPLPYDGDHMLRASIVEGLDDPVQVLLPLQYAPLVNGAGSLPTVTFRNYAVASGKAKPRPQEEVLKLADLDRALAVDPIKDQGTARPEAIKAMVESAIATHEAITTAVAALKLIRDTFIKNAGHESAPKFDGKEQNGLSQLLAAMDNLIVSHRPALAPAKAAGGEGEEGGEAEGGGQAALPPKSVPNHEAARSALLAAEGYFRRMEPSSPSLILVHQAASLIGRPLVEALAALMPSSSSKATLRLGGSYEFDIDLSRMKSITEDALTTPIEDLPVPPPLAAAPPRPAPPPASPAGAPDGAEGSPDGATMVAEAPPAPEPEVEPVPGPEAPAELVFFARTRAEASSLMQGAEAFFRVVEPSSPIPLLLEKARGYLNRDFASIMSELAPKG